MCAYAREKERIARTGGDALNGIQGQEVKEKEQGMIKHYARERMFVAGSVARVNIFPVRKVGRGRGAKRMPSRPCQEALNHRNSLKLRKDIVQLNFPEEVGGITMRLDYKHFWDEFHRNPTEVEWKAYLAQFVRRLKTLYQKHGAELKMVKFTHIGRKNGRKHHHLIFTTPPEGITHKAIKELWPAGFGWFSDLEYVDGSVENLVGYLSDWSGECWWSCTRNCKRPSKEDYADGTPASVHYIDGHVTMADAHYIDTHRDDFAFIKRLFPGWEVRYVTPTAEMHAADGSVISAACFGGPFVEIELYLPEAKSKPVKLLGQKRRAKGGDGE